MPKVKEQIQSLAEELLRDVESTGTKAKAESKYQRDRWIAHDQIYVDSYGWCWGVMPETMESVCLGKHDDVKAILEGKPIPDNQCEHARIVLEHILENIKEEELDGITFERSGIQRRRPVRSARSGAKESRLSPKGKRTAIRQCDKAD